MVSYTNNELARFNGRIIFPGVILIRPQDSKQFTSNIMLFDDHAKLVVDTGGFQFKSNRVASIRKFFEIGSNDMVLFSHYHLDHTMGSHAFSESQKIIHQSEKDVLKSMENYFSFGLGKTERIPEYQNIWKPLFLSFLKQEGLSEWTDLNFDNLESVDANETLSVGERIIEIIHLPGHSPGHCGVYERISKLLFIGDIDIGLKFGPWYGWANSDLGIFRRTIEKLKGFITSNDVSIVIPSHSSPIDKQTCLERLEDFSKIFDDRKRKILEYIAKQQTGTTIEELVGQSIIHQGKKIHFWEFFEQIMIKKHLKELEAEKRITYEGDRKITAS